MKKDWDKLTVEEQKPFEDKADYLLDKGYVEGMTVEELAKQIHKKQLTNNHKRNILIK